MIENLKDFEKLVAIMKREGIPAIRVGDIAFEIPPPKSESKEREPTTDPQTKKANDRQQYRKDLLNLND